jgi:hypothetical protein
MRRLYRLLIHLHPRPFRVEFGPEMMAIFDQASSGRLALVADAVISLFRQWIFRPQPEPQEAPTQVAGAPAFTSLEPYRMRSSVLVHGGFVTAALFVAVIFLIDHPGKTAHWLVGMQRAAESLLPISRSSLEGQDLDTTVRLREPENDPWRKVAIAYYRYLPLMRTLDIDGDYVISERELVLAPASLRSLDRNHDGKLEPQEYGFSGGAEPASFIRRNPVLAVIDSDGDGELSASEIRNAAEALRTLDRNGDGDLTPYEYLPHPR